MAELINVNYENIKQKINQLKANYPSLRDKSDDYVFTILCIKSHFYKNPTLTFNEHTFSEMIVDGVHDGGVDAILTDPNSDESNLVIVQSKFYQKISLEDVRNAVSKMATFYNDMQAGNYGVCRENVTKRFLNLNAEVGDESKVIFVFYTSASKNGIRTDRIEKVFNQLLPSTHKYELHILYDDDVCEEIKEAESRRPTVEIGKISIDEANNVLWYGDDAAIVSASAFCIKELYGIHGLNLLSQNLRYHISGGSVDKDIRETIKTNPDMFWYKNNGLTIICDNFEISGKEVKLTNFSIINGGQTTYNLFKSQHLNKDTNFFLPCKIIRAYGDTDDEKRIFSLEIAKATNSQKAIKPVDLKANAPEQVRFATTMRNIGVFYQTKRGEVVPKEYKEDYKNTDLAEVGKLCLSAVFQLPAASRNKPSTLFDPAYYELIFNNDQNKIARLAKQLLYMDYYFRNDFLKKFDAKEKDNPNAEELIPLAHNARTICLAFAVFASRYKSGNISSEKLKTIFTNIREGSYSTTLYDIFKDISDINLFFPNEIFDDKDKFDALLYKLYDTIIKSGRRCYSNEKKYDSTLNETNYLKKDNNYYSILRSEWDTLYEKIDEIFEILYAKN